MEMMQIQLRHDTAAAWMLANPVLAAGELGVETDSFKAKFGDGVLPWNDLPYLRGTGTGAEEISVEWADIGGDIALNAALTAALDGKVDAVQGKALSDENYTAEEKEKLAGLENADLSGYQPKSEKGQADGYASLGPDGTVPASQLVLPKDFGKIRVADTLLEADMLHDTLEILAGDNVTLSTDAAAKKITIAAKGGGGQRWTVGNSYVFGSVYKAVRRGAIVMVAASNGLWSSVDSGVTFQQRMTGAFSDIDCHGSLFVACGQNAGILVQTRDGINLTNIAPSSSHIYGSVCFDDDGYAFVAAQPSSGTVNLTIYRGAPTAGILSLSQVYADTRLTINGTSGTAICRYVNGKVVAVASGNGSPMGSYYGISSCNGGTSSWSANGLFSYSTAFGGSGASILNILYFSGYYIFHSKNAGSYASYVATTDLSTTWSSTPFMGGSYGYAMKIVGSYLYYASDQYYLCYTNSLSASGNGHARENIGGYATTIGNNSGSLLVKVNPMTGYQWLSDVYTEDLDEPVKKFMAETPPTANMMSSNASSEILTLDDGKLLYLINTITAVWS